MGKRWGWGSMSEREGEDMSEQPRPISFPYNAQKAAQVVLWLLHKHGGRMDRLKMVKLVFLADREHLLKFGRPIVGGEYWNMPLGPVSGELLDHVKGGLNDGLMPFEVAIPCHIEARAGVDEDELSESDMDILTEINNKYGNYSSSKLSDMTHQMSLWKDNAPEQGGRKSLPYENFFLDCEDPDMLDIIRDHQAALGF